VLRYNATTDTKTYYDTVAAANSAASGGEFVLVPPGTWSVEELLLKDTVPILEMFPGSVILSATSGTYAVGTPVTSGTYYIAVRRIEMEREYSSDIFAFYGQHASGEGAVLADLHCCNPGSSRAIALGNYGAGTVHYTGDPDVLTNGTGAYAVRNNSTGEIVGVGDAVADGGSDGFAYFIRNNSTGTVKWRGDADVDTEGSDVYNDYAIGIQNRGGTIEWRGFMDINAQGAEAIGIQSYVGGGSIDAIGLVRVFGQDGGVNGIVVGHTPDVSTCGVTFRGRLEISTADGAAYGSMMSPTQGNGTIELHADVVAESTSGPAYGVRNDGPGSTTFSNGTVSTSAGGVEARDLYQAGGTLTVSCCEYDHSKVTGTITLSEGDKANNSSGQALITGGGTVALGGFTLTIPATGTAALLDRVGGQSFTTGPQIIQSVWRLGDVVLDLDFTGTSYDTKAECQVVGLRFSDADTPFPDTLVVTTSAGGWTHVAGEGWQPSSLTADNGPGIIVPLMRPGNWELEAVLKVPAQAVNTRGLLYHGYIVGSNHVGAFARWCDTSGDTLRFEGTLWTNDGDDTFSQQINWGNLASVAGTWTVRFVSRNGCVGGYESVGAAYQWYTDRQCSGVNYTPTWAFLQYDPYNYPTSPEWVVYIQSLKLTYLL